MISLLLITGSGLTLIGNQMTHFKKQLGQAFPVGIAVLLFLALTSAVLFNTGQVTSDKTRVVNTADSAAYSGLVWQARALNFQAYTNRAMVANQVAMAQAVSLNSWAEYIDQSTGNLYAAFGWVPYLGTVLKVMDAIGETLNTVLDPISQGMLLVVNALNTALSFAQEGMYYATFAATPDVIGAVVKSNDTEDKYKWETAFTVFGVGKNLYDWSQLTERFDENHRPAMQERAALIRESTDRFTDQRNWRFFSKFIPTNFIYWYRFEKHGETKLLEKNGKWEWKGKDALSLRQKRIRFGRSSKYTDVSPAIGWAESFANSDSSSRSLEGGLRRSDWLANGRHGFGQERAHRDSDNNMNNYSGIRAYRSLTERVRNGTDPNKLLLRVEVQIDADKFSDREFALGIDEKTDSDTNTPIEGLTSISTAELFFEKPCMQNPCIEEYANGYNPFWDVRLSENEGVYRLAAYAANIPNFGGDRIPVNRVKQLAEYDYRLANPLDDFSKQTKGLTVPVRGWDKLLEILVVNHPEYIRVFQRLSALRQQLQGAIDQVAASVELPDLNSADIGMMLAEAAGIDDEMAEYELIKNAITDKTASLQALRDEVQQIAGDTVEELKNKAVQEIEEGLKEVLTDVVQKILLNQLNSVVGTELVTQGDVDAFIDDQIADVEDSRTNYSQDGLDATDIEIDFTDECGTYEEIRRVETEIEANQQRFVNMQLEVSRRFAEKIDDTTSDLVERRSSIRQRISEIDVELGSTYNDDQHRRLVDEKNRLLDSIEDLPDDRVDILADQLIIIAAEESARAGLGDGIAMSQRDARYVVRQILDDTANTLTIDPNAPSASEVIFQGDPEEEDASASDLDEDDTELPPECV